MNEIPQNDNPFSHITGLPTAENQAEILALIKAGYGKKFLEEYLYLPIENDLPFLRALVEAGHRSLLWRHGYKFQHLDEAGLTFLTNQMFEIGLAVLPEFNKQIMKLLEGSDKNQVMRDFLKDPILRSKIDVHDILSIIVSLIILEVLDDETSEG